MVNKKSSFDFDLSKIKKFFDKHAWRMIIISGIVLLIDQLSKLLFLKTGNFNILPFLDITVIGNTGASFGILEGNTFLLSIVSFFVVGFILYLKESLNKKPEVIFSLGLILGGTLGNLVDRLFRKAVVDFIHIHFSWLNYPAFNIADSSIVIGTIILFIAFLRKRI
jgi:signal peptidase II